MARYFGQNGQVFWAKWPGISGKNKWLTAQHKHINTTSQYFNSNMSVNFNNYVSTTKHKPLQDNNSITVI